MSVKILEVESNYETVTYIGYTFRVKKYVYPYFLEKNYNVDTLFENDAIRVKFAPHCMLPGISFISVFGHGYDDFVTGQHGDILWKVGAYDPREPAGKIIHLMSCLTAKRLGPDLVDKGALVYFGYEEPFTLFHLTNVENPLEDDIADVFFQCSSQVDRLIADNRPAGQVYDATKTAFREKYEHYLAIESDVAMALLHDHDCFRIYGNQEVCLPSNGDIIKEITLDTPETGELSRTGDSKGFILKDVKNIDTLIFTLNGPTGSDFDLYIRKDQKPELRKFDYRGYTESSNEKIMIESPGDGDYYVMVHSYNGMGMFTLKATGPSIMEGETIELGETVMGELENQGDSKNYILKGVEKDEELFVALDGPDGADFDVYVKFGSTATEDNYDLRGYTGLPDEKVIIYPTKDGDYSISVHSYRGKGEFSLKTTI
jgi:hypothetical protein